MDQTLWVFRDEPLDGPTNMARDEHLLYSGSHRPAALRLYRWTPPTISLGCFQRYGRLAELPAELRRLPVVRRPTGGGAILHDRELTYCLVLDDTLAPARQPPVALYRFVHELWRQTLVAEGLPVELADERLPLASPRSGPFFCFEKPGRTDLLLNGAKLLGSAQRRIAGGVLQHGSLLLGRRYREHPGASLDDPPPALVARWVDDFIRRLADALALTPQAGSWGPQELADVERRRERYADDAWTRRR